MFLYNDGFGIKWPMKVDMPLSETYKLLYVSTTEDITHPPKRDFLGMTPNYILWWDFSFGGLRECDVPLNCYQSKVHSEPEW